MKPYISVILDAHHHGPYLRQALDSIVDQSFTDYELILIDRAPSGEDQQELRAYAWEHLSALQILCLPPGTGQAVALNQGFAAASGQIVSMLSSNDYWYPNKLDAVARDFGDAQKVGLHQHHLHISKGDRLWGSTCREVLEVGDLCELAVRTGKFPTMFSPLSGLSFSRQILQLVGPIPGQLKEHADEYLTRTVMCYGRLTATDAVHGAHRPGAKSSSPTSSGHHQLLPALHGFYSERGIDIKYTQFDGSNSATSHEDWVRLLGLTPGDVVLAVRTAQPEVMGPLLTELQRVGAQVHLIVQNNVAAHYADQCHQMYLIDNDRIGPASFSAELKTALAETKPRLGVIPYEGLDGRTYGNVHAALNGLRLGCPLMGVAARGGAVYPVPPPNTACRTFKN